MSETKRTLKPLPQLGRPSVTAFPAPVTAKTDPCRLVCRTGAPCPRGLEATCPTFKKQP